MGEGEEERRAGDLLESSQHTQSWVRREAVRGVMDSEVEAESVDWRFPRKNGSVHEWEDRKW